MSERPPCPPFSPPFPSRWLVSRSTRKCPFKLLSRIGDFNVGGRPPIEAGGVEEHVDWRPNPPSCYGMAVGWWAGWIACRLFPMLLRLYFLYFLYFTIYYVANYRHSGGYEVAQPRNLGFAIWTKISRGALVRAVRFVVRDRREQRQLAARTLE